jgi:hypothetical protein
LRNKSKEKNKNKEMINMAREYTDEDMRNMSTSVYLSVKEGETVKCVTLSGINTFNRGDRDMAGRIFDGGRFNKDTEEQMRIFDLNYNQEKILNVPLYLQIGMSNFLRNNNLKVSDLKSEKLLLEIYRQDSKEWDIKLIDRNYNLNQDTEEKSETANKSKEDLKFSIFKTIAKNDKGTTIEEILNSLGGNIESETIEKLLEDLTFRDRKIRKFENLGKEYYVKR